MSEAKSSVVSEVIDLRRVDAMGAVYDVAMPLIKDYLAGKDVPEARVEVARVMVAQFVKLRQTDNARAALNFMMSRQIGMSRPLGGTVANGVNGA
jgi:hypothetical protein